MRGTNVAADSAPDSERCKAILNLMLGLHVVRGEKV